MTHKLLGELTDAEIGTLVRAHQFGKEIEFYDVYGNWAPSARPEWYLDTAYRTAPEPIRQAILPWDIFTNDIVAVAMDEDGDWHAYQSVPLEADGYWSNKLPSATLNHIKFDRGNEPNWRNTLQMRPGQEAKE